MYKEGYLINQKRYNKGSNYIKILYIGVKSSTSYLHVIKGDNA